jgi:hypothetical protein
MTNFSDQLSLLGLSFRTKECCFRYLLRLPIPMRGEEVEKGNRERRQGEECRERSAGRGVQGEECRERSAGRGVQGEECREVERREENEKRREEGEKRSCMGGEEGRGESQSQRQHMMDNTPQPQLELVIEFTQHCRAVERNGEEKSGKRRCRFNTNTPRKCKMSYCTCCTYTIVRTIRARLNCFVSHCAAQVPGSNTSKTIKLKFRFSFLT